MRWPCTCATDTTGLRNCNCKLLDKIRFFTVSSAKNEGRKIIGTFSRLLPLKLTTRNRLNFELKHGTKLKGNTMKMIRTKLILSVLIALGTTSVVWAQGTESASG